MQLPQDLQHFPHLTLIVLSDNGSSKLLLAGGESLEELDGVSLPADARSEHEHTFIPSAHDVEADRLNKYAKLLAEHIVQLMGAHAISHLSLVMPTEIEHLVFSALPTEISAKIMKRLHVDAMNEAPLEVVQRLLV